MGLTPAPKKSESGIALFMVLTAISVLALLVTELTFTSQMNQKIAYDGLDQVKALYLAKSGFKLSLLRLKAYMIVKEQISAMTGGATGGAPAAGGAKSAVPQSLLDKIWSFPFIFPIPTAIPGLTISDKSAIDKFQTESGLDGSFNAIIESESSKYNINMILPGFQPAAQPSTSPSGSPTPGASTSPNPSTSPSVTPSGSPSGQPYSADESRKSLSDYLTTILNSKFLADPDLENDYREFKMDDFMDALVAWADPSYDRKNNGFHDPFPSKHGPFYSLTELHMLPGMDDQLYDFFAPALTVSRTPGININTMQEPTLRALLSSGSITDEEVKDFFKFRDDPDQDNTFQTSDDFFTYLKNSVAAYKGSDTAITALKTDLSKRNVRLITDESEFKITVTATVNQSTRKIEAWVTLIPTQSNKPAKPATPGSTAPQPTPSSAPATNSFGEDVTIPEPGVRITFMRVS